MFTAVDIDPRDSVLLDAIYDLGRANPQTADVACSPFPYPQRSEIDKWAQQAIFVAVYDGVGALVAAVAADATGRVGGAVCKRFIGPNDPPGSSDEGNECARTMFGAVKDRAGTVAVMSPNPNTKEAFVAQGAEVPNA